MLVELNNATGKLAVIGDPVDHSLSPLLQNTMLGELGLNYIYMAQFVPRGHTAEWLAAAKTAGYAGFNATMPHKTELLTCLDEVDEEAARYQAVNTVCIREGRAVGYNTDGEGLFRALAAHGVTVAGKRVTLLGTGGAARSTALKLLERGAESLTVCNRTVAKAEALCREAPERMRPMEFTPQALARAAEECDILLNATSLGMEGTEGQFDSLDFVRALPPGAAVCDFIYAPAETALLGEARQAGHATMNGHAMLVHQGILALELFTGTKIDGKTMGPKLEALLKATAEK